MKNVLFFLLVTCSALQAQAQGFLRGKITDGENGEPLIGATVLIQGTTLGASADLDGNYSIKLQPGTYTVVYQFISYQPKTVSDIIIKNGETTTMDVVLSSASTELEEIIISADQARDTENAMLVIQKKSVNLVDGISDQTFRKLGDNDLGVAMKRVTGVSVQGGKYVYVRGLGDRYTKTTLNGMNIPGLDPDNNAVQIDIFPTNTVENVIVYKTFSPNLPGDFTGGLVDVESKNFPDEKVTRFSIGMGYNPDMNLKSNFLSQKGGRTDFLGFDNGYRKLPFDEKVVIPEITSANGPSVEGYTRSFNPELGARTSNSLLNHNFAFNHGNQINFANKTFGYNAVVTYRTTYEFFEEAEYGEYFKSPEKGENQLLAENIRKGPLGTTNVEWSGLITSALKFDNHSIAFNLLRSQNGMTSTTDRRTVNLNENPSILLDDILTYTQRSVTNALLSGKHNFKTFDLEWKGAYNKSKIYDPDFRVTRIHDLGDGTYDLQVGVGAGIERFYRDLNEDNYNFKMDVNYPLNTKFKLKGGLSTTLKKRDFEVLEYYFRVRGADAISNNPDDLLQPEKIWTPEKNTGIYVKGNYDPSKNFNSTQDVYAGYAMSESQITSKLKAIYGVRLEKALMHYTGANQMKEQLKDTTTLDELDLLPSVNLVYSLQDQMNIRVSANRTLARPTFKEKSNAQIYDPISDRTFIGNLGLQQTYINNYDIRWENFFTNSEMVSVSAFYKTFDGHIEVVSYETAPDNVKPRNAGKSSVFGAEVEFRKSLNNNFSIGSNASIVKSQVDLNTVEVNDEGKKEYELRKDNAREGETIKSTRPMAGQSPFLINAFVGYENEKKTLQANLAYNVQGQTLSVVGSGVVPDVYSKPFNSVNLNISQTLGKQQKSRFALTVNNILGAQRINFYKSFGAEEKIYSKFKPGRTISLTYAYTF